MSPKKLSAKNEKKVSLSENSSSAASSSLRSIEKLTASRASKPNVLSGKAAANSIELGPPPEIPVTITFWIFKLSNNSLKAVACSRGDLPTESGVLK